MARTLYLSLFPSHPPPLPTLQAHTHLSSSHHPAIQPWDETAPSTFWLTRWGGKNQVMISWNYRTLPIAFLFFWTHFVLFPCPRPLGKASSPHTQQWWCPHQASATAGFKLQQLSPRVENFQNVLPWQPGILAQQKPPPHTHSDSNAWDAELPFIIFFREKIQSGADGVCLLGGISNATDFFPGTCISWFSWQPLFNHCIPS